mmetsp:Transcript_94219/g.196623  ORF Transcript_94219/g.196623 Transcript_94219/m.196623 type:complete len:980 (-) Transcript_94219:28-2967(-)
MDTTTAPATKKTATTTPPKSRGHTPPPGAFRGSTPTRESWRASKHEDFQKSQPPAGDSRKSSRLGGEAQGVLGGPTHQSRHSQSSQAPQDTQQPTGTRFARSKNVQTLKKEADFYDRALRALKYTSHEKDLKLAEDILQDKRLFRRDAEPNPWAPMDVRLGEARDMPVERVMMRGAKAKLGGHYGYIVGKLREPRRRHERDEYDEGCGAELQEGRSYSPAPAADSRSVTPPGQRGASPRKGRGAMSAFPDRCLRYREGVGARAALTPWLAEAPNHHHHHHHSNSRSPARRERSNSSHSRHDDRQQDRGAEPPERSHTPSQREREAAAASPHTTQRTAQTKGTGAAGTTTARTTARTEGSAAANSSVAAALEPQNLGEKVPRTPLESPSAAPSPSSRSRSPVSTMRSRSAMEALDQESSRLGPQRNLVSLDGPDRSKRTADSTARSASSGIAPLTGLPGDRTFRSDLDSLDRSEPLAGLVSLTREAPGQSYNNLGQTSMFGTTLGSSSPGPGLRTPKNPTSGRSVSPGLRPRSGRAASPRAESVAGSESAATTLASVLLPAPFAAAAAPSERGLQSTTRSQSRSAPVSPAPSHRPIESEKSPRPLTGASLERSRATSRESSRGSMRERGPSVSQDLDHLEAARHRPWLLWEEMQIKRELERQAQRAKDAIEKPAAGQVTHLFHYHVQPACNKENNPNAVRETQVRSFQSAKVTEALTYPDNFKDEANRSGLTEAESNFRRLFSRKAKYAGEPITMEEYLGAACPSSPSSKPAAGRVPRDHEILRHGKLRQEFQGRPGDPPVRAGVGLALDPRPNDPPYPLHVCASRKGHGVFADGYSEECSRLAVHHNPGMYRYAAENHVPPRARSLPPADSAGVASEKQRRGLFEWARGENGIPLRSKSVEREKFSNNSELMGAIIDVTRVAQDDARLREERLSRDKPFADLCHITVQNTQKMNEDLARLALREKHTSSARMARAMAWE